MGGHCAHPIRWSMFARYLKGLYFYFFAGSKRPHGTTGNYYISTRDKHGKQVGAVCCPRVPTTTESSKPASLRLQIFTSRTSFCPEGVPQPGHFRCRSSRFLWIHVEQNRWKHLVITTCQQPTKEHQQQVLTTLRSYHRETETSVTCEHK